MAQGSNVPFHLLSECVGGSATRRLEPIPKRAERCGLPEGWTSDKVILGEGGPMQEIFE